MPARRHSSLAQDLHRLLNQENLTVGKILEAVGEKSFGLLFLILSLPSALPVPAPGYSTPFGILISLLAFQFIFRKKIPWLPKFALKQKISPKLAKAMLLGFERAFRFLERFVHPRFSFVFKRIGHLYLGILIILMACLMILPIPLTNTAPAFIIFLIGIAITEEDGFFALLAGLLAVLATFFYIYLLYIFFTAGIKGVLALKNTIKNFLF